MLGRQLESTRINWLRQQKNVAQNTNLTHYHQPAAGYDMPELAAMFEKSSGEPDTFARHYPQTNVGNDDLASFVNVLEPGTEFGADKVPGDSGPRVNLCSSKNIDCQMEMNEMVVLDNDSDDDWFFVDDFESFVDDDCSGKRKAVLPLEDCTDKERTEVAAMESLGCKSSSSKNAADAWRASENKKLGTVRGRIKCPSRRDSESFSSAEKKRRQKIHDKLQCLRNMIPWSNQEKKSKTDLLDETIVYLKYLENQYLNYQLLLAQLGSQDNPTPVIKPKDFTARKMSSPAAANDYNFAYPAQQVTANFITETERQLAFASQVAAPWGSSTSALSIPAEQYVHGASSFRQELPITYDPNTQSLLHQSFYY